MCEKLSPRTLRWPVAAVLAAYLSCFAVAHAQDEARPSDNGGGIAGVVNAAALRPLPEGASISLRAWDNSDANLQLVGFIEDLLRSRGRKVTANGDLVLSISASDQPGHWGTGQQRQVLELQGRMSTAEEDEARVRLNLFSTDKGGIFNDGPTDRTVRSTYTLEMTVDSRTGQRLWQGEASAALVNADGVQQFKQMVPPLLDALGKTVRSRAFGVR